MVQDDARKLVGFFPADKSQNLNAGMHFITKGKEPNTANDEGWMTSVASPLLLVIRLA